MAMRISGVRSRSNRDVPTTSVGASGAVGALADDVVVGIAVISLLHLGLAR